jgi:hypothetical protein
LGTENVLTITPAPPTSKIVRLSILLLTLKAILAGKFALMVPVIIFTDGLLLIPRKWTRLLNL